VLRLVAGALHERHTAQLISLLATKVNHPWPAGAFAQPPWNLALAVQCLAEVRNPHTAVAGPAQDLLRRIILLIEHCVSIDDRDTMALIETEILPAARTIGATWPGGQIYLNWYRRRGVRLIWSSVSAYAAQLAAILAPPSKTCSARCSARSTTAGRRTPPSPGWPSSRRWRASPPTAGPTSSRWPGPARS
jgi:hypothetical protein